MRKILAVLDAYPDDNVDFEALLEQLLLLRDIEAAENEVAAGDVVDHEDVKQEFARWLE